MGTGEASMMALRMRGMSPPVERSITVSAPYFTAYCSLASSSSIFEVVAELPMLALILHFDSTPMHIGSRLVVIDVGGDDHAAARDFVANQLRGVRPSRCATYSISPVIVPWRA